MTDYDFVIIADGSRTGAQGNLGWTEVQIVQRCTKAWNVQSQYKRGTPSCWLCLESPILQRETLPNQNLGGFGKWLTGVCPL